MSGIILHHYWPSPVAEKVRVVLGLKGLSWQSVEIPRIPPKPDVVALTGGYRRTPVMQIESDVYCDSQCIIRELERRYAQVPLLNTGLGDLLWGFTRWTDGELFTDAIRVVLGAQIDTLDADFLTDRARLYFGKDWTKESIAGGVQQSLNQLDVAFGWMESELQRNKGPFLLGTAPSLVDAYCYYVCWFIRGRYEGGAALLDKFEQLAGWEKRISGQGYGQHTDLDSADALDIAKSASSSQNSPAQTYSSRHSELINKTVLVRPAVGGGDPYVEGMLVELTQDEIVVARSDERAGNVRVHFPTMGYEYFEKK